MTGIIDTEVHLMHPSSIQPEFAKNTDEPVRKAIHEHADYPGIKKLMTLEALLESMERNSIDRCHLMGMSWRRKEWLDANNTYIKQCVERYPRKFTGFYIPHLGNIEKAAEEIKNLDNKIFLGVKVLPNWQGVEINDPALSPILKTTKEKDLFFMVHTDHMTQSLNGDTPQKFLDFVIKNPELKILAPHLGGLICLYQCLPKFKEVFKNVYFITSVSFTMQFVKFASELNPDNLLFGTDFPFNHCHDQNTQIKALREMGLSNEVQEKILYKNALRIFNYKNKI